MVQYGIKRAAVYGFTAKRDVCKYIDLMILFGRDFDTDKRSRSVMPYSHIRHGKQKLFTEGIEDE